MNAGAVEELILQSRVVARGQARLLELVLQVADEAPDLRFGVDEIACALTLTRAAADAQLDLARQLIRGLPQVFTALSNGDIDLPKARVFADTLCVLDLPVARDVAGQVLPIAPRKTTAQLRDMLHRRALAADPAHARKRREKGERERRVIVEPAHDGTATLTALGLPAQRAQAAFERITAIAKARRMSGSTATIDQLRADTLLDLLEGKEIAVTPGARRGVIELIVGLETLAGLNEDPAILHGFGPVAADVARQCAAANLGAQWRFSVLDPDGQLLLHGTTRARPGTADAPSTPTKPTPTRPTPRPPRGNTAPTQARPANRPARPDTAPTQAKPANRPARPDTAPTQARPAGHPARPATAPIQARSADRPARPATAPTQARPATDPTGASDAPSQTRPTPCSAPTPRSPMSDHPAQSPSAPSPPTTPRPPVPNPPVPLQPMSGQSMSGSPMPRPPKPSSAKLGPLTPSPPTPSPPTPSPPTPSPPTPSPLTPSEANSGQPMLSQPVPCPPPQDPGARFPNAAMAAWIRARDRTCRAPGCRIPARACHLDHTTDYARGGRTTHDDLGPLCGRHHVMKHEGSWQLRQIKPGHFIWISPSGRIYHVRPEPP